ncbi:MAG: acetate/propionate family kinase [Methylobacter sp.]|uniref:acetate/propionate family kinase n=1 Tax=Methylobacter sp. TaxID=2051955 RepID=UPI0025895A4A|nr:acetate/propionate family kinase [Methylobacter sp.]MCL7422397.1 acetate/propionate family kinase [Methylobacter sp.]
MQEAIIVINAGSSSIKFAIFAAGGSRHPEALYRGEIAGIGSEAQFKVQGTSRVLPIQDHQEALRVLLDWLDEHDNDLQVLAVGHRIVHGGSDYIRPVLIDEAVLADLTALVPLAPLHQPHNLSAVRALRQLYPELTQVACFDTAFHHTIPEVAHTFALPKSLYREGVRRYGFHGLSYEYIIDALPAYSDAEADGRVVIAHLGQGASLCAVRQRQSIATTMTFTPLDGLPMGTRCGSIDPAVVLYLLREKHMTADAISDLLHYQSGLAGLSGISGDMKTLLASDQADARKAVDVFVYHISRELGSLAAALGGLDTLVFTAGIGERAAVIREKICSAAAWLGIDIDPEANQNNAAQISSAKSRVSVRVIPTNEEQIIAYHTYTLTIGDHND